jgi:hypothetical protein
VGEVVAPEVERHDRGPLAGEGFREGPADPPAGPGDEDDAVPQVDEHDAS